MNSHDLAHLLLSLPNLPVATQALNHTYMSEYDRAEHGPLKVGRLYTSKGDHLIIGNINKKRINPPSWYVLEMYLGLAPDSF